MSAGRLIQITADGDYDFGEVHDGFTGRWVIQVIALSGATLTPKVSADGTNFVTRAVTPADNSADVTSIAATGLWIMDALTCEARLTASGGGTATVFVKPAIG
jgi:hypothetical protein